MAEIFFYSADSWLKYLVYLVYFAYLPLLLLTLWILFSKKHLPYFLFKNYRKPKTSSIFKIYQKVRFREFLATFKWLKKWFPARVFSCPYCNRSFTLMDHWACPHCRNIHFEGQHIFLDGCDDCTDPIEYIRCAECGRDINLYTEDYNEEIIRFRGAAFIKRPYRAPRWLTFGMTLNTLVIIFFLVSRVKYGAPSFFSIALLIFLSLSFALISQAKIFQKSYHIKNPNP